MQQAVLIRLRPIGAWRFGPGDGGRDRVDSLYRSDRLFSAVTLAMQQLGFLDEWLAATAQSPVPAVVFSSLFPYQGDTLFVPPPATLWPPPLSLVTTPSPVFLTKIRWTAARFVPVTLVDSILAGQRILADQWIPDAESGCLLRRDRPSSSPYRTVTRNRAAVDRLTGSSSHAVTAACIEWESGSGLWAIARFANEQAHAAWNGRLQGAFRFLADTGFGAGRTHGLGHTATPEFQSGSWPSLLFPKLAAARNGGSPEDSSAQSLPFWLLSLFSPAADDSINWQEGSYATVMRGGIVESPGNGSGAEKKRLRMIGEGSVLLASKEPVGSAVNVAPDGFAHPVYRSGFALSVLLPELGAAAQGSSEMDAILAEAIQADEAASQKPLAEEAPAGESPATEMKEPESAVREESPAEQAADEEPQPGTEESNPEQHHYEI